MQCAGCGTEISSSRLSCPACHGLVHRDELERLAKEAEAARGREDAREEILSWRRALELLPPDSEQSRAIAARVSELSPIVEKDGESEPRTAWRWAGIGAVVTFLVTKGKFLLAGLTKSGTFFTMFLSLGVYWAAFGWKFAAGLIASIYVHEMGHVAALQRLGIRASAPMFVPGLGAMVRLQQYPVDAREDARVGLAGPIWGLGAAVVAAVVFYLTEVPIWGAIARVGAWINLFNLLPLWQLDGGRGFRALSKTERFLVSGLLGLLWFWTKEGLLMLLLIVAVFRAFAAEAGSGGDRVALAQFVVLLAALSALTLIQVPL
jgi:Zn-dependent protease